MASLPHWYDGGDVPTIVRGDGSYVYDEAGEEYLDVMSILYCANAGHGHPAIVDRMTEQLERVQYGSTSKHNDARSALASRIVERAPASLSDVFFSISGSEANEATVDYLEFVIRNEGSDPVAAVREHATDAGVLVGSGRPDIQLICSPPFTVDEAAIDNAVDVLDDAVGTVFG